MENFPLFFNFDGVPKELRCGLIGNYGSVYQYLQERSLHEYQLDVLHDFIKEYKETPSFAFLHLGEYTHNDQNLARLYDDQLYYSLGNMITLILFFFIEL